MYLQRTRSEAVFAVFNIAFLIVLSLAFVIPFLSIISTSLIGVEEWARRGAFILFPQHIEFGAYQVLFTGGSRLATGFFYSVARILVGTALNLFFTATLAYVLSPPRPAGAGGHDPVRVRDHDHQRRADPDLLPDRPHRHDQHLLGDGDSRSWSVPGTC